MRQYSVFTQYVICFPVYHAGARMCGSLVDKMHYGSLMGAAWIHCAIVSIMKGVHKISTFIKAHVLRKDKAPDKTFAFNKISSTEESRGIKYNQY